MRFFEKVTKEQFTKNNNIDNYDALILPHRATKQSAGYDFYLGKDYTVKAKSTITIYTGIKAKCNDDEFLMIVVRSSIAIKKGLKLKNQIGIIDADYYNNESNEGEIIITLENESNDDVFLYKDERVVQGIFLKYYTVDDDEVKKDRKGGVGSTD